MRHLKLIWLFWSTSLGSEAEYRINFLVACLSSLGNLVGSLFALSLFYQKGGQLGDWRWLEALIIMALFTILQGTMRAFLNANLSRIVEHVRTGTLDFILLKPVSSQFWLSMRRFSPSGLPDLLIGIGMLGYASHRLSLSPLAGLVAMLPLASSLLILYSLWYVIATTTIWFVKIYNVTEVLQSVLAAGRFPIDAFPPGVYRFFFTFVIPVAFMTTVPARFLLGRGGLDNLLWSVLFALGLFTFSCLFWRFALRSYGSASS
ncbi:MAG TPA: ABC-2 family transporter protein [Polyangiaceae bacterium]|jgi:ABC-2 type transport system permease protein